MKRGRVVCLLLLLAALGAADLAAQFATIRGRVMDATSDEPLPGATVVLDLLDEGRQVGQATDTNGLFVLRRIPPGSVVLTVSYVGFLPFTDTLRVEFNQQINQDIMLEPDAAELSEVVVETERAAETRPRVGEYIIRPAMMDRVPMPDVSADLAAYLVTLPGFVTTGDRGGQLFVRGGTPTQNLILVDGMPIYQPFHIVGFYSAFPADIVAQADVYAGGFGARYGGRISSVIDVQTRNGNKQRPVGAASLAPFLSAVRIEVPIAPGKVSLLASVRESVIERVAPNLLGEDLPFQFGDRFAKLHAYLNRTSSLSFTALQTFDAGFIGEASEGSSVGRSTWRNSAYGGRYHFLPPDYPLMTQLNVYATRLESTFRPNADEERDADISGFNTEILFLYLLGDTQINFGLYAGATNYEYEIGSTFRTVQAGVSTGGAYFDSRFPLGPSVRIEPGVRIQAFSNGIGTTIGPRLRAQWTATERMRWSVAWGIYHQQLVGLNNEQNISNVFTVWAPVPDNVPIPEAHHYIAGVQQRLLPGVELSVEAYHKTLRNIAFPRLSTLLGGAVAFNLTDGYAEGVDVQLEVVRRIVYANLTYSLGRVEYETKRELPFRGFDRQDQLGFQTDVTRFNPPHDRRHQLGALVQLAHGAYRVNVFWQFGTGLPYTKLEGYFEGLVLGRPGDPGFLTQSGTTFVARGDPYAARLPTYHRLDVSVRRVFALEPAVVTVQAGVINAYNRANVFDYNFFTGNRIDQLPLIPSLGIEIELK